MKAGVASPNGIVIRELPDPAPGASDLLVKVKAAALNRADLAGSKIIENDGTTPVGIEFSGEVIAIGDAVRDFKPGDRIMCHASGSHAELAVCDYRRALKIPDGMSYEQAATLPVALNTLHNALVTAGRMTPGDNVLVQGASSGVGLVGLRMAKLLGAKLVVGTSTNDARRARLTEFGADLALNTADPDWPHQILAATGGKGLDLTVDMLSGPTVNQTMRCTAVKGRIVNIGRLAGMKAEFDFDLHARKRIDYIGVTFRTRSIGEIHDIMIRMRDDLWEHVTAGKIQLPIDATFPLAQAAEAHAYVRANKHFGKVLVLP
jgi:NADPH2:quinone reductase